MKSIGATVVSGIGVGANVVIGIVVSGPDVVVESTTGIVVVKISSVVDGDVTGSLRAQPLRVTADAAMRAPIFVMHQFYALEHCARL